MRIYLNSLKQKDSYVKAALLRLLLAACFLFAALSLKAQTLVTSPMTGTPAPGDYYSYSAITLSTGFSFTAAAGQSLRLYITDDCTTLPKLSFADKNYIVTSVPRKEGFNPSAVSFSSCDVMQTMQYFDGLGRPQQTVQVMGSPGKKDVVQPVAYDQFGRESVKYLPYAATTVDGAYKTDALSTGLMNFYYPSAAPSGSQQSNGVVYNPKPYSVTNYEPSPLNRVVEQGAPGPDWQPAITGSTAGHTVKIDYTTNDATSFIAKLYTATVNSDQSRTLTVDNSSGSTYPAGQLYVTVSKDENWTSGKFNTTEEYKDKEGHVVLKRTFNQKDLVTEILSTYYVYDDLGNLAFVLPPGAAADAGITSAANQVTLDNFCYQYQYDERNRLTQKKLPGKGWEYMVYNKLDQVVYTQDAVQRANHQWSWFKYDAFGRTVLTGVENNNLLTRQVIQNDYINAMTGPLWEERIATRAEGYTARTYPTAGEENTNIVILTIKYYDDYSYPGAGNPYPYAGGSPLTKGLPTASKTRILNPDGAYGSYLWMVYYYDDKGRVINTRAQHYLKAVATANNYDEITTRYNFNNQPDSIIRRHYTADAPGTGLAVTVTNRYTYDHMGRKTKTYQRTGTSSSPEVLLSSLTYNELGQLYQKNLQSENGSSTFLQNIIYGYNERGWLSRINDPGQAPTLTKMFSEELKYNNGTDPQYNGNIANQLWYTRDGTLQTYTYSYDKLNRLTGASSTGAAVNMAETGISYDLMGNIKTLKRDGSSTYVYDYNYGGVTGNKLNSVSGLTTGNYGYDLNGNMTTDARNKVALTYNYLNLPKTVTRTGLNISYTYDAEGQKLRKVSDTTGTTDYVKGIQYAFISGNYGIDFVQTEEGRAKRRSDGTYYYEYDLTDHLGNLRVTFQKNPTSGITEKIQADDYYAFGKRRSILASANNKYLYNKKELQEELGQYDYGARFYDPVIGRFTTIDKFAEKYAIISAYQYGANNPIKNIDVRGDSIYVAANIKKDGRIWDSFETLKRTPAGRREFEKFSNSTTSNIYVSGENSAGNAVEYTYANIQKNEGFIEDGELSTDRMARPYDFKNLDGHKIKNAKSTSIVGVNLRNLKGLDKYDMAFAFYHEMVAHIDGQGGDAYQEHDNFGNFNLLPGLGLHTGVAVDGDDYNVKPGSSAWSIFKELLELKIKDGKGTDQNKKDLEEMKNYGKKK